MKKTVFSVIGLIIVAAMVMAPFASYADFGRSYTAPKGTPSIDGTVEDLWNFAEWTQVDKPYDGSDAADYPGASLRVKVLWDEKNCYFLAEITDSDVNYDNDIVEIYFDENNAKEGAYEDDDSQTRFYKDGVVVAGSGTNCKEDSVAKGVDTATGWIIEGALPWTLSHKEGDTVGFELMYNIGDSDADFAQAFRWNADTGNGDPAPYADNTAFGALILGAAPAIVTEPAAPQSAFSSIYITEDTELYDDPETVDLGGSGQPIQYMEAYGVGYSSLNDQVIFHDVDFGENGADKMWINFSFGAEDRDPATLAVYIDQKAGDPVATFTCGFTGGWESEWAQEFESACSVAPGVHNVIVEFTNESSGSFNYIRFNEAPPIVVETEAPAAAAPAAEAAPAPAAAAPAPAAAAAAPAAAPVAAAAPAAAAPAAQTGDAVAIAVLAAVAALGTAIVIKRR